MSLSTVDEVQAYLGTGETNLRVISYAITHRRLLLGLGPGSASRRLMLVTAFYLSGYLGDGTYTPRVSSGVDARWGECLIFFGEPVESGCTADDGARVIEQESALEALVIKFKFADVLADMWTPSFA